MKRIAIIAAVLIGCSSKPAAPPPSSTPPVTTEPTPPTPTPTPTPPNDPPPTPPPSDPPPTPTGSATGSAAPTGPGIAAKCGDGDACAAGLECVKYLGIGGGRGPQFKTCEKRCKAAGDCPTGRTCRTIADGPGQVCR